MSITRRRLVEGAAALLPAATIRGSAANSAVTVGLIGAGGRGTYDATLLSKLPGARIVAVCDVFEEKIQKAKSSLGLNTAKTYTDYKDLLASDVDAVLIATPVYLHPEHFDAAVKAGKHIYIEKPAGADVEGCKRVMRAADSADRKLNITFGFQQRYAPLSRKAQKLVSSGGIGKLRTAHSHWIKGINTTGERVDEPKDEIDRIRKWKNFKATFGDYIVETYCHGIDVLNWFLGGHPVKGLASGTQTVILNNDMRDTVNVTFTYPGNVLASLKGTQITPVWYRDVHEVFVGSNGVVETGRQFSKHFRAKNDVVEEKEPREITIDALEEFVRRASGGSQPENTGVSAAESTLTAILARMSMDLNREVSWEEMMR